MHDAWQNRRDTSTRNPRQVSERARNHALPLDTNHPVTSALRRSLARPATSIGARETDWSQQAAQQVGLDELCRLQQRWETSRIGRVL